MKIQSKLILTLLASLVLSACDNASQDDSKATPNAPVKESIVIGTSAAVFPGTYKKEGELTGFDIEVAKTVANNLNYDITWVVSDFSGIMGQLELGKIDTVANIVAITPKRAEKYDFSSPYGFYGSQLVTHTDRTDINTLADFREKTISGVLGSNHVENLKKTFVDTPITIKTYEFPDIALKDAVAKRVDGYVNSRPILLAEIRENNLPIKLIDTPIATEKVGFPFAKNPKGQKFKAEFDKELAKLRENGTLKALSIKYFTEDITQEPSTP